MDDHEKHIREHMKIITEEMKKVSGIDEVIRGSHISLESAHVMKYLLEQKERERKIRQSPLWKVINE